MKVYCTDEILEKCKYGSASSNYKKAHDLNKRTCDYILITGHKRPCHWEECTVFEERTDEDKNKKQNNNQRACYRYY